MQHPTRVGKYEIEAFLGGGMSHVYRATDRILHRTVAVKVMTEQAVGDAEARGKFLQEARIAAQLEHENIIRILDYGEEIRDDDAPRPYMVLEFVQGESLRAAIQNKRTGNQQRKLQIALEGARALAYVHSRSIVHRDVKPENLHIDRSDKVRLMDFGVAKAAPLGNQATAATPEAGAIAIGTPFYMAPEQVLGREPTHLTDIYAYGLMAYELFTGERPVPGKTVDEIFHHILYDALSEEPWQAAGVSQTVHDLFIRCTNKQLAQRPQSMDEICTEIEKLLAPEGSARADRAMEPEMIPGILSSSYQRPEPVLRLRMPPQPSSAAPGQDPNPRAADQSLQPTAASA